MAVAGNPAEIDAGKGGRWVSLDVLRGITVALMILVNNAGDGAVSYPQLRHSVWSGCTLTDLVFPMFLFIVGASIALAFEGRLARGVSRVSILRHALERAWWILLIGLALNFLSDPHLAQLRYYGVLQRIALCYALSSVVYLWGGVAGSAWLAVVLVVGYWGLLTHVRVPGFGMPGVDVPVLDPHGNLTAWLDRTLVPGAHLYHHGFYDPEGLLGTLPSVATTLLGVLATAWLRSRHGARKRVVGLGAAGALLISTGLLWSHWLPLNKRLWTSSYVLYAGGISMAAFAVLFWCIDGGPRWRRGLMPWLVLGTNALAAYILSEVLAIVLAAIPLPHGHNLQQWLYGLLPQGLVPAPFVSMVYSVLFVLVCGVPIYVLYRKRMFLKI